MGSRLNVLPLHRDLKLLRCHKEGSKGRRCSSIAMASRLTCGNLIVLGVDLLAMHVGDNNDIDQCCNGAAVASTVQLPHAELHRGLTREDDHGNLCRSCEVHRSRKPPREGISETGRSLQGIG